MPRTRIDFTAKTEAKIVAMMGKGGTAKSISKVLLAAGVDGASPATITRRMRELRGKVKAEKAPAQPARSRAPRRPPATEQPLPPTPEAIPEGASLDELNEWLRRAEKMGRAAEEAGDLQGLGAMGRLSASLLEARRKAQPVVKPDPNDDPDMVAMGEQVAAELHKLVDKVVIP